jgi:apolipoprotein N-acyltransferase
MLAAGSGAVLALALPGPGLAALVLAFPILLLEALRGTQSWWRAGLLGWLAGTVHWAIATHWVLPVMHDYGGLPLAGAVVSLLVMSGLLGLTWAAAAVATSRTTPAIRVALFPAVWIALEAWRQWMPYAFPWNTTAAAFAGSPEALASLPVWGATGLGWAATAIGAALWGLARRETRAAGIAGGAVALLLLVACTVLAPAPGVGEAELLVAVLQPGTSLEERWDPSTWPEILARVWRQTHEAAAAGAELVLWPEGAVPFVLEQDDQARSEMVHLARSTGTQIVVNSVGSTADGGYTNAAFLVGGDGLAPERYDKVRLVPFGEYVPALARWAISDSLVREVAAFTAGDGPVLLPARAPLGVAICYEVVFADLVAAQVRSGARVLVTLTNDGWYGTSWAPEQHFAQAVLRAAETRRWLARAALSGVSGFVTPSGAVHSRLEVGDSGVLLASVTPASELTLRTRWGDWWAVVSVVAAIVLLITARSTGRTRQSATRNSSPTP